MMRGWLFTIWLVGNVACGTNGMDASCPADEPASCPSAVPSYTNDIAPLIETYCSQCHNPQGSAFDEPISTYADLSARKVDVLGEIYECQMPMPPAPQPSVSERVTLLSWFVCGAPNN